ncbi:hypothetical protein EV672_101351 [Aquabacterium commune]|uniref:Uncharacterized protein n=1 Tax=Aquabacterium commune TaxID=70586 RepID=A0A4R6RQP0_9BURK|nr:hypothetical protein [Aquabacterium commune]TDP88206.1 hypothetical protein EV672_101351 [Aquabacterium commune]
MPPSSRLHAEWLRLYAADTTADPTATPALVDAQGRTRTLVLALGRPADWATLSAVWQAVQAEGGLPAPGIAVSGTDSFHLWFSLAEAVPVAEAHAFLRALCQRCLGHIGAARLSLLPALDDASVSHGAQAATLGGTAVGAQVGTQIVTQVGPHHAAAIPAQQGEAEQWSAFVAPDLAPMFNGAPWLDLPPSPEGQAELLSRLRSIQPTEWRAAQAWLHDAGGAGLASGAHAAPTDTAAHLAAHLAAPAPGSGALGPHAFLRQVMNDASVPLALRIEAAKALLPHTPPCP